MTLFVSKELYVRIRTANELMCALHREGIENWEGHAKRKFSSFDNDSVVSFDGVLEIDASESVDPNLVPVERDYLVLLLNSDAELNALEEVGVGDWKGYDSAIDLIYNV